LSVGVPALGGDAPRCRFAVIYRWRLKTGAEAQFVAGWTRLTHAIRAERGGLGSRLHRLPDGSWLAYAQWPSRDAWEQAQAAPALDPEGSVLMREAIVESEPPLLLEPVADLLLPILAEPPAGS
jgi:quinol monooxygenase YgiN